MTPNRSIAHLLLFMPYPKVGGGTKLVLLLAGWFKTLLLLLLRLALLAEAGIIPSWSRPKAEFFLPSINRPFLSPPKSKEVEFPWREAEDEEAEKSGFPGSQSEDLTILRPRGGAEADEEGTVAEKAAAAAEEEEEEEEGKARG